MKEYFYNKDFMFYVYSNYDIANFKSDFCKYAKNSYDMNVEYKHDKSLMIEIKSQEDNVSVNIKFIYNDELFNRCYKFYKHYDASIYKGSRKMINVLFSFICEKFLIVTKKEPLVCEECREQIGWIFNDLNYENLSICAIGSDDKEMYESFDIVRCSSCGKYYCHSCCDTSGRDYGCEITCDKCNEKQFNDYLKIKCDKNCCDCIYDNKCNYEDNLLSSRWASCKYDNQSDEYMECDDCEYREECISNAEDSEFGYACFCDCVLSGGYDSMDDFWECNGI